MVVDKKILHTTHTYRPVNQSRTLVASCVCVSDLQEQFQRLFPYLQIKALGKESAIKNAGRLFISDQMTVAELRQEFKQVFGIAVTVSRQSGNVWLETQLTADWSLAQQNLHGWELSLS